MNAPNASNPVDGQADAHAALAARAVAAQALAHGLPSPCVSVCRMDAAQGICAGCLRTLDEIAGWGGIDDDARRRIWGAIEQRARHGLWGDAPTGTIEGAPA